MTAMAYVNAHVSFKAVFHHATQTSLTAEARKRRKELHWMSISASCLHVRADSFCKDILICQYSQSCLHSRQKTLNRSHQESKGFRLTRAEDITKRMEFSAKDCTERQYDNTLFLFQVLCMRLSNNSFGF